MNTTLTAFHFEGRDVRTSTTESGEPLFVAKDVCDALGLEYTKTLERVPDWTKGGSVKTAPIGRETSPSDGEVSGTNKGGRGHLQTLTEAGVYWVALRSNKPNAEAFQRWVCTEVLPALRRDGFYRMATPGSRRQVDRLRLRLQAAELRARAQAIEALARGDNARPEEGGVTERPEGWLTVPEFVATQLPPTDWRRDSAAKRLGWALRKARVPSDTVRARTGNSLPRRVFRPDLLAEAWQTVSANLGDGKSTT